MKAARKRIDLANIAYENGEKKSRIDYWQKMLDRVKCDDQRKGRLEKSECPICFYERGRIGGATMTERQCGLCDARVMSGNTNVDVLCKDCAKATGLCKHCGADVDLKDRRKRALPIPTETRVL